MEIFVIDCLIIVAKYILCNYKAEMIFRNRKQSSIIGNPTINHLSSMAIAG